LRRFDAGGDIEQVLAAAVDLQHMPAVLNFGWCSLQTEARSSAPFARFRQGGRRVFVIYVENAGGFTVPLSAVESGHSEKVVLNCAKLDRRLRHAIGHAHDGEEPGA
jgi:hypothetical protein